MKIASRAKHRYIHLSLEEYRYKSNRFCTSLATGNKGCVSTNRYPRITLHVKNYMDRIFQRAGNYIRKRDGKRSARALISGPKPAARTIYTCTQAHARTQSVRKMAVRCRKRRRPNFFIASAGAKKRRQRNGSRTDTETERKTEPNAARAAYMCART